MANLDRSFSKMSEWTATPVGRLVGGSAANANVKDFQGKPLTDNNGNPRTEYFIQLAIPKTDPEWARLYTMIQTEARTSFPGIFDPQGNPVKPFSWKITDGDSQAPNSKGKKPCDREGWPGHWILNLSHGFAPSAFGKDFLPIDPTSIKLGFYVKASMNVKGNGQDPQGDRCGVYLNFQSIMLVEEGTIIQVGPSAQEMFGGGTPQHAHQTHTPPASAPPPAAITAPATTPPPGVTPAPGFVNGPPAGNAAPGFKMAPSAPNTYEQYRAAGWTDDQLIAQGHMVKADVGY